MRGLNLASAERELDLAAADAREHEARASCATKPFRRQRRPSKGFVSALSKLEAYTKGVGWRHPPVRQAVGVAGRVNAAGRPSRACTLGVGEDAPDCRSS